MQFQFDPEHGNVLLVNKPLEWTSFDVVNKLRYALLKNLHRWYSDPPGFKRKIKVGHAGTLDPLATGLLIICTGKQTKQIEQYMATDKTYTGVITVGHTTPSYDLETVPDCYYPTEHITPELIAQTAKSFIGIQEQIPPVFSAIKQDGKRLYTSARNGEEVVIKSREIEILDFKITQIDMPHIHFEVSCSKGTYIRSLAYDFGKRLNSGAHLSALCRTRSGEFSLNKAWELNSLIEAIQQLP
jgi:tRNA pseudouridine55 synthase